MPTAIIDRSDREPAYSQKASGCALDGSRLAPIPNTRYWIVTATEILLVNEPLVPTTVTTPDSGVGFGEELEDPPELPPPQLERPMTSSIAKAAASMFILRCLVTE